MGSVNFVYSAKEIQTRHEPSTCLSPKKDKFRNRCPSCPSRVSFKEKCELGQSDWIVLQNVGYLPWGNSLQPQRCLNDRYSGDRGVAVCVGNELIAETRAGRRLGTRTDVGR